MLFPETEAGLALGAEPLFILWVACHLQPHGVHQARVASAFVAAEPLSGQGIEGGLVDDTADLAAGNDAVFFKGQSVFKVRFSLRVLGDPCVLEDS